MTALKLINEPHPTVECRKDSTHLIQPDEAYWRNSTRTIIMCTDCGPDYNKQFASQKGGLQATLPRAWQQAINRAYYDFSTNRYSWDYRVFLSQCLESAEGVPNDTNT